MEIKEEQNIDNKEQVQSDVQSPDHHSIPNNMEDHIPLNSPTENDDASSVEEPVEVSSIEAENSSDDQVVADKKSDIPQWGKDNPEKWGKYKARLKEKEYQKKVEEQQAQIEQFKQLLSSGLNQNNQNQSNNQTVNENLFHDPETGMQFDITTPEGESIAKDILAKEARNNFKNKMAYQQYEDKQHQHEMALAEKIEEAKFKYKDYEDVVLKNGHKFTKTMVDIAALMTDNNSNDKFNGSDFLYFLGKNPQELARIRDMSIYDQYKAVFKHAINFGSKSPQISKAPEPIKPLQASSSVDSNYKGYESAKDFMRAKYCKQKG